MFLQPDFCVEDVIDYKKCRLLKAKSGLVACELVIKQPEYVEVQGNYFCTYCGDMLRERAASSKHLQFTQKISKGIKAIWRFNPG